MKKNSLRLAVITVAMTMAVVATGCGNSKKAVSSQENTVVATEMKSTGKEDGKIRITNEKAAEAIIEKTAQENDKTEDRVLVKTESESAPVVVETKEETKTEENTNKVVTLETKNETTNVVKTSKVESEEPVEEVSTPAPAPAVDPIAQQQAVVDSTHGQADRVIAITNLYRLQNGLGKLYYDPTLAQIAQRRAEEIVTCWSHTRPDGTNATALASEYGLSYGLLGENLGKHQTSADQVCDAWMNSPGHRANLLGGSFNRIGVGIVESGGSYYWVQIFAD